MKTLFHKTPENLREAYIEETIETKINVFAQKINFATWSDLVVCLSFLESILQHYIVEGYFKLNECKTKINIYNNTTPLSLTKKIIKKMCVSSLLLEYNSLNNKSIIDESEKLKSAVAYRNVIMHDCTYLGGDKKTYVQETLRYILAIMSHEGILRQFFRSKEVQKLCSNYIENTFEFYYKKYCLDYSNYKYCSGKKIFKLLATR